MGCVFLGQAPASAASKIDWIFAGQTCVEKVPLSGLATDGSIVSGGGSERIFRFDANGDDRPRSGWGTLWDFSNPLRLRGRAMTKIFRSDRPKCLVRVGACSGRSCRARATDFGLGISVALW